MSINIVDYKKGISLFKLIQNDGECKICKNIFDSGSGLAMHLRKKHNITFKEYLIKYFKIDINKLNEEWESTEELKKRKEKKRFNSSAKEKLVLKGDNSLSKLMNYNYKCKICGKQVTKTTNLGKHLTVHNITFNEYLLKYFEIDVDKLNEEWENGRELRKEKQFSGFRKYWEENKGKTYKELNGEEQYLNLKKKMKGVFSKEWFISKFGEVEGLKKYKERSINLSKNTYWKEYNKTNKQNWSKVSQELFWEIYKRIFVNYKNIYFGELNHELSCGLQSKNFDFVVKDNKKIIEFNGDKFHANPRLYNEKDIPLKFIGEAAEEIWKKDEIKNKKAIDKGYHIKIVWESDYLKNKEKIILECIDFINGYENS